MENSAFVGVQFSMCGSKPTGAGLCAEAFSPQLESLAAARLEQAQAAVGASGHTGAGGIAHAILLRVQSGDYRKMSGRSISPELKNYAFVHIARSRIIRSVAVTSVSSSIHLVLDRRTKRTAANIWPPAAISLL
jgi:hypothetical protein